MRDWIRFSASLLIPLGVLVGAHAEDHTTVLSSVPMTRDLAAEAVLAAKEHVPLLLVFTQDYCDYCDQLDREVLNPYYSTGAFNGKAIVRRFMIDSYATVTDFDGKRLEASTLMSKFKVYATPALLFVDAHGHELVQRIVGINSVDFFAAYLEESIAAARVKLPEN